MFDAEGVRRGCAVSVTVAADLFDAATVEALAERLVRVLERWLAAPDVRLRAVEVLSDG